MNKYTFLCFALGIIFSNANATNYRTFYSPDFSSESVEVMRPVPIRPVVFDSEDDDFCEYTMDNCPSVTNTPIEGVEVSKTPYELTFSVWCKDNHRYVANMVDYEMQNKTRQFYGKNMFFDYEDVGDNCLGSELAEVFPNISVQNQVLTATGPLRRMEDCILEKCESSAGNNELFTVMHHLMQMPAFQEFKNDFKSQLTINISTAESPVNYLLQVTAH